MMAAVALYVVVVWALLPTGAAHTAHFLRPPGALETVAMASTWPKHPPSSGPTPPAPPPTPTPTPPTPPPSPPHGPVSWYNISRGAPGGDSSCSGKPGPGGHACIFDRVWCELRFGQCAILEHEVKAKCGQWSLCAGAVCRADYGGYCLARGEMTTKTDSRMWGYSKYGPPALPVTAAVSDQSHGNILDWGAHRVRLNVTVRNTSALPVTALADIQWRRRDVRPEAKDVLLAFRGDGHAAAQQVHNRVVLAFSGSSVRVLFDTTRFGAGLYEIYYLPFISNGAAFGRKDAYLGPLRRNGTSAPDWLRSLAMAGWRLNEQTARGANSAAFVSAHTGAAIEQLWFEAQTPHDLFTNMEVAATDAEIEALVSQQAAAGEAALLIPYTNLDVVRSFAFVPTRYLEYSSEGEPSWNIPAEIELRAAPNQFLVWQLAIVSVLQHGTWSNISNIRVSYSPLTGSDAFFPRANLSCFNIDGVSQSGEAFTLQPFVNTSLGSLLPLWLGIDIGMTSGSFRGAVTVIADVDGKSDAWKARQNYSVAVTGAPLLDRGDSNASLLSRVRWINSRFGQDGDASSFAVPSPFTPIVKAANSTALQLFNKRVEIGVAGFPISVNVRSPPYAARRLIGGDGMKLIIAGGVVPTILKPLQFHSSGGHRVDWTVVSEVPQAYSVTVNGSTQFDGFTSFVVEIKHIGSQPIHLPDVRVSIPLGSSACRYMMKGGGTGVPIGNASAFEWAWTAGGAVDNLFWIGGVQAGVRLRLRGPEYSWLQPRGPFHYGDLPSTEKSLPRFWHNNGSGGVTFSTGLAGSGCTIEAFTGPLKLAAAEDPVLLHFDLVFTPNKPLDTTMHFQKPRYYQMESTLVPAATLLEGGVNIANVHQGNPYAAPCSTHLTHSSSSRLLDQVPLNRCFAGVQLQPLDHLPFGSRGKQACTAFC
jgi:hypothetical protein